MKKLEQEQLIYEANEYLISKYVGKEVFCKLQQNQWDESIDGTACCTDDPQGVWGKIVDMSIAIMGTFEKFQDVTLCIQIHGENEVKYITTAFSECYIR